MRKVALVLTLCLAFLCQGCFEKSALSVIGTPESEGLIGGRIGTEIAANIEVGASILHGPGEKKTTNTKTSKWWGWKKTSTTTVEEENDWYYGGHAFLHVLGSDGVIDPYVGGQVAFQQGNVLDTIQPVGGVNVGPVFAEYQHESLNGEDDKIMFGIRVRF